MKNIFRLTKEEQKILRDIESGKYKPVKNQQREIVKLQQYARATLNKTRNINIRISDPDLRAIKVRAMEKGLPYQTFIGSLLHQYSTGKVREVVSDR